MKNTKKLVLAGGSVLAGAIAAVVLLNSSVIDADNPAVVSDMQKQSTTAPVAVANAPKSAAAAPARLGEAAAEVSAAEREDILQLPDENPDYATLGARANEIAARRNGQPVDLKALREALAQDTAWGPLDGVPPGLPLTAEEQMDGREFIRINPMKIESLVPGDSFELDIAQINRSFTAVIDEVQAGNDNNVTWVGHLKDHENESRVVFTRGDSLIVGGMTTPNGHFEMETRGEYGWIASSATLFKTPDVLLEVPADELAKTPATLPPSPEEVEGTL